MEPIGTLILRYGQRDVRLAAKMAIAGMQGLTGRKGTQDVVRRLLPL
jgi:hypothetical protein